MVAGRIRLPAVPAMVDEYVRMCDGIFADVGVRFTALQLDRLRVVLEGQLAEAFAASPRSDIVISYDCPVGSVANYHVRAESRTIEGDYEDGIATRNPLFGTAPDARVWALVGEAGRPDTHPILDVGAGIGRNALALAERGHPVDAVEMASMFAGLLRAEAEAKSLDVHVIEGDVFATVDELRRDYQLIVLSGVVSDFRATRQLRGLFQLADYCLVPGGRLVFNAFLARHGYTPDTAARELGQQCYTAIFTRDEMKSAAAGLPLQLVADDSVYEYESTYLPVGAWPPTSGYPDWVSGLYVFDVEREASPIEMRWLVYQKPGWDSRPRA